MFTVCGSFFGLPDGFWNLFFEGGGGVYLCDRFITATKEAVKVVAQQGSNQQNFCFKTLLFYNSR
jgi:hypothetical protein